MSGISVHEQEREQEGEVQKQQKSKQSQQPPSKPDANDSYTIFDLAHASALRFAKPVFVVGALGSMFALPALAPPFNLAQRIVFLGWYSVPALRDVGELRSYYASNEPSTKQHASLGEISWKIACSTSFMVSVVGIGCLAVGKCKMPATMLLPFSSTTTSRLIPSLVGDLTGGATSLFRSTLSPTSQQFALMNAGCAASFIFHYISLGYYMRLIPHYLRVAFENLRQSAITLAQQRRLQQQADEKNKK